LKHIAQAIARHAAGFGMEVRYHSRQTVVTLYGYEPSAVHLAQWCDFRWLPAQAVRRRAIWSQLTYSRPWVQLNF
jgi:hypothetical protein